MRKESQKDTKYKEYLKGKSVALVGPAEYLTNLDTGSYIDSFDIVVRINRGMEVIETYSKSIGKRTDILYNCLIESPDNGGIINIRNLSVNNVAWIATIPGSDVNGVCTSDKLHKMVKWFTVFKIKRKFSYHIMDYQNYTQLNKKINSRANTGFAAIFDLLDHDVCKLYITGFSFYLDDFINGYKEGCSRSEKEFAKQCFASKRHQQVPQWDLLKKTLCYDKRIEVDPVLEKILAMTNLSREKSPIMEIYDEKI